MNAQDIIKLIADNGYNNGGRIVHDSANTVLIKYGIGVTSRIEQESYWVPKLGLSATNGSAVCTVHSVKGVVCVQVTTM